MDEQIEIHVCARDETYRLLICQEIDHIRLAGGVSEEGFAEVKERLELNESEQECLQNNLTILGLYGSH